MRLNQRSEDLERFADHLSKELEQPINTSLAALLHIESQLLPAAEDPVRRLMRVAIRNLAHVTFVLEQAETFADLRALKIHPEPARIRDVLIEVSQDVALRDGGSIAVSCPAELAVDADLVWIGQILNDLVTRADKVNAPGTRQTLIGALSLDPAEVVVRNAIERAPRTEGRLDPRDQASQGAEPDAEWLLTLCRAIVSTHGGRFWTRTDPHEGFVFCMTLPVSRAFERPA